MIRAVLCALTVLVGLSTPALAAPPHSVQAGAPGRAEVDLVGPADDSSLLVRFHPGVSGEDRSATVRAQGGQLGPVIEGTGFFLVSSGHRRAQEVVEAVTADRRVAVVEPNYLARAAAVPSDPLYPSQVPYLDSLRIGDAWSLTTGADDLVLAVVDSGVDLDHPDLAERLLPGRDIVNGDDSPEDDYGHGTQVATIAGAGANDGTGMVGVVWRGKILPVKVLDDTGSGRNSDIASGITWAADHGADVINLSIIQRSSSQAVTAAIDYAQARDVLIVAAAGNDASSSPLYPAAYDGVVAVAAVDLDGELASFSNYGSWIDLAAPGVGLLAGSRDGGHRIVEGTSFAAPIVSGVALLTRARFPRADAGEIAQRMRTGARDVGVLGRDDVFGYGIVDALGALGGPRMEYHLDPAALVLEPDSTPDRASRLVEGRPSTARLAPADDVDWFYTDVAFPAFVTYTITPPGGQTHAVSHQVTVYRPGLHSIDGMTVFASPKSTTVRVPAGRYYLRVRGNSPFAATGTYQLSATSTPAPVGNFDAESMGGAFLDSEAGAVAIGDVTGDGAPDLVAVVNGGVVLVPQEAGHFERVEHYSTEGTATGVALGDLDGDGALDAVAATSAGAEVFRQLDDGLSGPQLVAAEGAEQVEIGDLDGDGRDDVVIAGGGIRVVRNGGELEVISALPVAEIEVADMDGDGRDDIVALECPAVCQDVVVYTAPLDATSARVVTRLDVLRGRPGAGCSLGVGEVNGNGRRDAFASCPDVGGVLVVLQDADGEFGSATPYLSGESVRALEGADLNADGRDDVVVSYGHQDEEDIIAGTTVLWQQSDGTLRLERSLLDDDGSFPAPKGIALGDVDGDGLLDVARGQAAWLSVDRLVPGNPCLKDLEDRPDDLGQQLWVRDASPAAGSLTVAPDAVSSIRFVRAIDAHSLGSASVKLTDASTGGLVPADVRYAADTNSVVLQPRGPLLAGHAYLVEVSGVQDTAGARMSVTLPESFRFAVGTKAEAASTPVLPPEPPKQPTPTRPTDRSGYWMVGADGALNAFGDAAHLGNAPVGSAKAVDLEPTPSGQGYWIIDEQGHVFAFGDAISRGNVERSRLSVGETVTSLSSTPSGDGYWVFTTKGRVLTFGDAHSFGDMSGEVLNGPVLDSIPTPSGNGYYMVASDGGIFAFGDAAFAGSMGGKALNAPVQSLVPDGDGAGYWLVASDGGVFAFDAGFRGSMGGKPLNRPVTGMVPFGSGYLIVGEDGGIFNFSDREFLGSLGRDPPVQPIVSVAVLQEN